MNRETKVICKLCGSTRTKKYGLYKGTQHYFCHDCKRKFSANDHLFNMRTPSIQVSSALNMYYSGMSINKIRDFLHQQHRNYPSSKTVYFWIEKYTTEAIRQFKGYHPQVGDIWVADETVLKIGGQNVWVYDIICDKTRFLIASCLALSRTTHQAEMLMKEAYRVAGRAPKEIITDRNASYLDSIELTFGSDTEHILGRPFVSKDSTNIVERWHGTLKDRTKVMRGLKSTDTAIQFLDGFLIYYNYFRPHEALSGKTPAEAAKVVYLLKTWESLIRNAKPQVEVLTTPGAISILSEKRPLIRPIYHRHYDKEKKAQQRRSRRAEKAKKHLK